MIVYLVTRSRWGFEDGIAGIYSSRDHALRRVISMNLDTPCENNNPDDYIEAFELDEDIPDERPPSALVR